MPLDLSNITAVFSHIMANNLLKFIFTLCRHYVHNHDIHGHDLFYQIICNTLNTKLNDGAEFSFV